MFGRHFTNNFYFAIAITLTLLVLISRPTKGQDASQSQTQSSSVATNKTPAKDSIASSNANIPDYVEVIGVRLGMSADEVRSKLDKPKDKGKTQDFFVLSDSTTAQVYYDDQGKVIAFSIDYMGKDSHVPTPEKILGESIEPSPDGRVYKLRRFPEAGYWIAYNKTAGDNPITTVTVQKEESQKN